MQTIQQEDVLQTVHLEVTQIRKASSALSFAQMIHQLENKPMQLTIIMFALKNVLFPTMAMNRRKNVLILVQILTTMMFVIICVTSAPKCANLAPLTIIVRFVLVPIIFKMGNVYLLAVPITLQIIIQ